MWRAISCWATVVFLLGGASRARADFLTLDVPGATFTVPRSISGGNVVGDYYDGSRFHGFLYNDTSLTTLNGPGATLTVAVSVSGSNVVGYYQDASSGHGFLYNG